MTQTPRDWQKDMEMCEAVKDSKWLTLESSATAVWQRGGLMSTIWEGPDAEALQEHKEALPYWIQEAKKQYDLAEELNNEVFSVNCEKETLDQTMKVGLERALKTTDPYEMLQVIQHLYSTLYPDTPAPTLTRHTCFHCEGKKTFVIPYEAGGPTVESCEICKGEGTLLYDEEQLKQLLPDLAPKEGDA